MKNPFILFVLFSLTTISCQNKIKENPKGKIDQTEEIETEDAVETEKEPAIPPATGAYFFDFEEVEYYTMPSDDEDFIPLINQKLPPKDKDLRSKLVFENYPLRLSNNSFLKRFEKIGFEKRIPNVEDRIVIKEAFRENFDYEVSRPKCAPVYRDIFVFRKKEKLIGIAKVCFQCSHTSIRGSKADESKFAGFRSLYELKQQGNNQ